MKSINQSATSIRTFIGAKDYKESRQFYSDMGYEEHVIDDKMSYFKVNQDLGFYLQDYFVKTWCHNSMVLLEIQDADECLRSLQELALDKKYKEVRFTDIKSSEHGREIFMHDPSGVLWHFYEFKK